MKKFFILLIAIISVFILAGVTPIERIALKNNDVFVTTDNSKYCYVNGEEHGNMKDKNKTYSDSLENCGKPYHE